MLSSTEVNEHLFDELLTNYLSVRKETEDICAPLQVEDYGIQTMPDVSPPKWHLAHTSWFFETFLLIPFEKKYQPYHPQFLHLFNSYYEQAGSFHPRPERGLLSRPTVSEVYAYRKHIDEAMANLLANSDHPERDEILRRTVIGVNHEQQHQELIYTDIKHIFNYSPLKPVYRELPVSNDYVPPSVHWIEQPGGVYEAGCTGNGFAYDNEYPRHKVYLEPFRIASQLVTNEEYLEFIEAGGYSDPALWLSDGWKTIQLNNWQQPIYWIQQDHQWYEMTLSGVRKLDLKAPVSHVSCYEANAFANWKKMRLPTEMEWEVVAENFSIHGNLRDEGFLHPAAANSQSGNQFFGDVWEWTQSSYSPYPGYRADDGALGEYNGKFMSSQVVLRGGSCVTPRNHIRATYRNFFYPGDRWQFSGIRLAETFK